MMAMNKRWYLLALPALIGVAAALLWLRPIRPTALQSGSTKSDAVSVGGPPQESSVSPGGSAGTPIARPSAGNRTVAVRRGTISERLRLFGRVVPQQEIAIVAPSDGKVASLPIQIGTTVSSGQLVAQLDPDSPVLGIGVPADPMGLMRAPWSGAITDVQLHVGDKVQAGQTVALLAKQADPLVRLDLTEPDAARMAVGQLAAARDPAPSQGASPDQLAGLLVDLATAKDGRSAVGMIQLDWTAHPPDFGTVIDLEVFVQQRTDVLLIPARAVHSLGDRHFVELMDGGLRKTANIEVGIVSGYDVEIRQGLIEGQQVIAL